MCPEQVSIACATDFPLFSFYYPNTRKHNSLGSHAPVSILPAKHMQYTNPADSWLINKKPETSLTLMELWRGDKGMQSQSSVPTAHSWGGRFVNRGTDGSPPGPRLPNSHMPPSSEEILMRTALAITRGVRLVISTIEDACVGACIRVMIMLHTTCF